MNEMQKILISSCKALVLIFIIFFNKMYLFEAVVEMYDDVIIWDTVFFFFNLQIHIFTYLYKKKYLLRKCLNVYRRAVDYNFA